MSRILIVEDEPVIRGALRKLLERHNHEVEEADSVETALEQPLPAFDLIISDLRLPGAPGTDLIPAAGRVPVLIMTSYASLRSAVDAMRQGAVDYIAKPFDHQEMVAAVDRILASDGTPRTARTPAAAPRRRMDPPATPADIDLLPGDSPVMAALRHKVARMAPSDSPILIRGEPGTGKERVAQAVHQRSDRQRGPFLSLNCAALPADQLESELFGHEKGAVPGAATAHRGLVESASGGSLFLDAVDELPADAQARLLHLLNTGEVWRLGGLEPRQVDVRILAGTHLDLTRLVREGRFREDLCFSLNVLELVVPPLRERGEDVVLVAQQMLDAACARLGLGTMCFGADALATLREYAWPGNLRELANVIERAVILTDGSEIGRDALGLDAASASLAAATSEELSLEDYFARFVLENQHHMTETELAKKLGISRKCLWERRQRLGIPRRRNPA